MKRGGMNGLEQAVSTCYHFDPAAFQLFDANAGYYIATKSVAPIQVDRMDDLIPSILQEDIELRVTPSLMPMKERILSSTVNFSMIRLRNAVDR